MPAASPRGLLALLLLLLVVSPVHGGPTPPVCPLTVDSAQPSLTPSQAALVFGGYNDVLGPVIANLPYADASVTQLASRLNFGALRHPGGTVANFWSMANGTYTAPCDVASLPVSGDHCRYAHAIATNGLSGPGAAFTPGNFAAALAPTLAPAMTPTAAASLLPIVFDLNLLTLSGDAMLAQVDLLVAEVAAQHNGRPLLIELGNEFFLWPFYGPLLPNASAYVDKLTPLVRRLRERMPTARVAAVSDPTGTPLNPRWDTTMAEALRDASASIRLFDAVTIHDYSANVDVPTYPRSNETLALWGPATLPQMAQRVRSHFGESTRVWMTEFNVGRGAGRSLAEAGMAWSVEHVLFRLNFALSATCETQSTWEILMLHQLERRQLLQRQSLNQHHLSQILAECFAAQQSTKHKLLPLMPLVVIVSRSKSYTAYP